MGKSQPPRWEKPFLTEENLRVSTATAIYQKWKATDAAAADKGLENAGLNAEQIQQIKSSIEK